MNDIVHIALSGEQYDMIHKLLTVEPRCSSECFGEGEAISCSADFGNGIEMDIKCCGVEYEEGSSNLAWTEAVLFDHGAEINRSDPHDEFLGDWTLPDKDGNEYTVHVTTYEQELIL